MQVITTIAEQRAWTRQQIQADKRIGFVPTMGALHVGHTSLIDQARKENDMVVVSIFVNPTQFDNPEDLEQYPSSKEADLAMCAEHGADVVFYPDAKEIYPQQFCTFVEMVGSLTENLCAISRPGHFRGVCTVVTKLFNIVNPDRAYFGQKDLQQALIITRMVRDLDFGVEVITCPTVRETDGLAMSSRNRRLSAEARQIAGEIPQALDRANALYQAGSTDAMDVITVFSEEMLAHPGVDLDYAQVISIDGFKEVEEVTPGCIFAIAVFVDGVRLIDHTLLGGPMIIAGNVENVESDI